jgi:hypothetical protein
MSTIRSFAMASTYAGQLGVRWLARLNRPFLQVTDAYGTNSHFCLSVLQFIDSVVLAHVDLALANANVLDPNVQPLLASGFVF